MALLVAALVGTALTSTALTSTALVGSAQASIALIGIALVSIALPGRLWTAISDQVVSAKASTLSLSPATNTMASEPSTVSGVA